MKEKLQKDVKDLGVKAMRALENQLAASTKKEYEALFPNGEMKEGLEKQLEMLSMVQKETMRKNREREDRIEREARGEGEKIRGMTVMLEENF